MPITHFRRGLAAVFIVSLLATVCATAQPVDAPTETSDAPGEAELSQLGEVKVQVREVGLSRSREGEWRGFQVQLTDTADKARDVFIRVEMTDADGDRAVSQRYALLNPNTKQFVWLYGWHPFNSGAFRFSVYDAEDRAGIGPEVTGSDRYRPGRRLGSVSYTPRPESLAEPSTGLIAVIGTNAAGLEQYTSCRLQNTNEPAASPTSHGLTETVTGVKVEDLPDRWQGLTGLEALVWTGRDTGELPGNLREPQAEAIREWVRRGGHLIIVMPSIGQTWFAATAAGTPGAGAGALNPLADIMPDSRPALNEGVDLERYRQLLTASQLAPLPKNAVVYTFDDSRAAASGGSGRAGPYDAMSIMKGEGGDTVVVRRLVGAGAVTVVGIDLARNDLKARDALQAGQFWNRVLGKRMRVFAKVELDTLHAGGSDKNAAPLFGARRDRISFDRIIGATIAKQSKAAAGLLAAFVVFLAYWLLAGPLGYMVLKQRNKRHHAWLVFVAATGLFSLVGWGASSTLKLGRDVDRHYTLLDHVFGQSNQRMRSWIELTLPKYGEQRVSVRTPGEADAGKWHHSLTAWEAGNETSTAALRSFPDARSYIIDARSPDTADFPARATTRQIQVDFAGAPPASWDMIRPVAAEGVELGREIYFEEPPGGPEPERTAADRQWKITGRLVHNLPGPLREVYVVVVREMTLRQPQAPAVVALMPAVVYAGKVPTDWEAGVPLDLDTVVPRSSNSTREFFLGIRGKASSSMISNTGLPQGALPLNRSALGQAFYSMLEPPDPAAATEIFATRESTHGWDLGRWFTQPCVIVFGVLGDESGPKAVECPIPISIDGASPEQVRKNIRGITVIRWIYPLPPNPPVAEPRAPTLEVDPPAAAPPKG